MLGKLIGKWMDGRMQSEAAPVLDMLRTMDRASLGMSLASATHARHYLRERSKWDLLRPLDLVMIEPLAAHQLGMLIRGLQRAGDTISAGAFMVWAHTLRASPVPAPAKLKLMVREMWEQLHLGDDYVLQAQGDYYALKGVILDVDGYAETPDGFRADRHPIHAVQSNA